MSDIELCRIDLHYWRISPGGRRRRKAFTYQLDPENQRVAEVTYGRHGAVHRVVTGTIKQLLDHLNEELGVGSSPAS